MWSQTKLTKLWRVPMKPALVLSAFELVLQMRLGCAAKKFGQHRPGPAHGQGGRRKGSGRDTRESFGLGVRRAVGSYLCETTGAALSSARSKKI